MHDLAIILVVILGIITWITLMINDDDDPFAY